MKKVALIMTGDVRQSWITAPSINKYVITPNNADCFMYFNRGSMEPNAGDQEEAIIKQCFPRNFKRLVFTDDHYNQERDELIESNYAKIDGFYKSAGRENWDKQLNHHNTDQWLKNKKACEMAVEYADVNHFKYDIIARVRPDIGWLNVCDFQKEAAPDTIYVNHSKHHVIDDSYYHWIEDTCVFGDQDSALKLWTAFSDKMVDNLELCDPRHDLTCATEKLLANVLIDTGINFLTINDYFGYKGSDWIRPKLSKHWVDWTRSPNFHLIEKYGTSGNPVYFDRIGQDVIMDPTIL